MNRELNVKLKLDNSSYLEAMQEIIDRTSMFKDEIDRVKDKLNELSSIKIETKINHNIDETMDKIQEVIKKIKELKENSEVTIDIKNKANESKKDDYKYKDMGKNTMDAYKNAKTAYAAYNDTIETAKKDERKQYTQKYSLGSEKQNEKAIKWIINQNSSVSEEELMKGIKQAKNAGLDYKKVVAAAADTSAGTGQNFSEIMDTIIKVNEGKANEVMEQLKAMGIDESQISSMQNSTGKKGKDKKGKNKKVNSNSATSEVVDNIAQKYSGASRKKTTGGIQGIKETIQNTKSNIGKVLISGSDSTKIRKPKGSFKQSFKNLGPNISKTVKNIGPALKSSISGLRNFSKNVGTGFKQILNISKEACGGIIKSIGKVFKMILTNPIGAAITVIIGGVILLYKAWTENWGGIRDKLGPIVEGIKGFIDSISPPIEKVIGFMGKLLGIVLDVGKAVTDFLSNPIQGIVDMAANLIGRGKNKGKAGKNALGTSYWSGGITWVGENGPELIDLPSGSQVFDNKTSKNMMGNNFSIPKLADTIIVREDADIDRIANALARKLKATSINMA